VQTAHAPKPAYVRVHILQSKSSLRKPSPGTSMFNVNYALFSLLESNVIIKERLMIKFIRTTICVTVLLRISFMILTLAMLAFPMNLNAELCDISLSPLFSLLQISCNNLSLSYSILFTSFNSIYCCRSLHYTHRLS
jgi:hypothetical protein